MAENRAQLIDESIEKGVPGSDTGVAFLRADKHATQLTEYMLNVPSYLQSPDVTQAYIQAYMPDISPEHLRFALDARRILEADARLRENTLFVSQCSLELADIRYIEDGVIRTKGIELTQAQRQAQLNHISRIATQQHVTMHVVPDDTPRPSFDNAVLLAFADRPKIVFQEKGMDLVPITDPEQVGYIDQVARLAGLSTDEVARREERAPGLLERLARTLAVASPEMFISTGETAVPVETEEETLVQMTERVIAEAAAEGRVVLVGRGAQAVLATRPNALHVYVIASKPFRRKVAIDRLSVDPAKVDKVIDETDHRRDQYVKTHYGRDRQDLTQYDFVLNAERLGFEGAAELVVAEVRRRRWV